MNKKLLHTPEGVRDVYDGEYSKKVKIEEKLTEVLNLYGYKGIQTPMFEFFDIFNQEKGTVSSKEMYKFFDREGNTLVLRPDMTPSIARCVAKYYDTDELPIRLGYKGNTFINNSSYQGKLKETTQLGAELVNDNSSSGDAEIIAMAIHSFLAVGITDFTVDIGQVEFYQGIVNEFRIKGEEEERLRELIRNKNYFGLEEFVAAADISEEGKEVILKFSELYGGYEILEIAKNLTFNSTARHAIEHLESVYRILSVYGYDKYVSFDLGMLNKYNYYTGIIFKGYTYGTGDAVMKGGRYDNLLGQYGKKAPSVGFAINVDELQLALTSQKIDIKDGRKKKMIVYHGAGYKPAIELAVQLRKHGIICEVMRLFQGKPIEEYIEVARKEGMEHICYFEDKGLVWMIITETGKFERIAGMDDLIK
ncbi:MAG: ATP phosphoribosyltransferase regulatory subunit [Anaerostipes sp.]|uniref:ATP phosphoribosyltransferase regulatory subunit n=1 Tax=Anaerostipes sp. 992a TaxID=1261637 RepID=UPI000951C52D|nr:ATP phosphoribosyltransferase regulatory subunit [Anaerostipes sp. 992a]MCI5952666.1 ATP phosphoribosyltransferase regulatory subunit [Anaerostipes sp.]MDD5968189.1 ATP phosphoribosyltransferase regulatory subunit [Anaerostipes sp.]OLR63964.1 ATP phosphoribosyltransferase regulatory subunit [Anaerostipes sp. 992a]